MLNDDYIDSGNKSRVEVGWVENNYGISYPQVIRKLRSENYTVMESPKNYFLRDREQLIPSMLLRETVNCYLPNQKRLIEEVLKQKEITAGITWVNNKCFKEVLESHGIPVIHHELGALRNPYYLPTAYLDFSGVNGNTEFDNRFKEFLKVSNEVPILTKKELIKVISPVFYPKLWEVLENRNFTYNAGVGLQVEVDTNVLLFNEGLNWVDPILSAESEVEGKILVRRHPVSGFALTPIDPRIVVDDVKSTTPYEFISKCRRIYCLNSSVGFEAMLLGREARILGGNPFYSLCFMDNDMQLKALNFAIFGYLIHSDLMFDDDYYRFRIKKRGNEKVIYLDNMKRLIEASRNGGKVK